jgi:hypothetical protein
MRKNFPQTSLKNLLLLHRMGKESDFAFNVAHAAAHVHLGM